MQKINRGLFIETLSGIMLLTLLCGCGRQCPPTLLELDRAQEVLCETSPRNLDGHPKVCCKNFIHCFDSAPKKCVTPVPAE